MATEDLGFNVFALDRASKTFIKLADRIEQMSDKLDELDRKEANPEINLDVDESKIRGTVRGIADTAEDEGRRRSGGFFRSLFTPDAEVIQSLRTGIPGVLSSPIGLAGIALGGVFAASFASAVVSAGALAGIGAGFAGLAAVVLKENARLKESFADLGQSAQLDLIQAANPLVPTFDRALSQVEMMFGPHIADPLEEIFTGLGPSVVPAVESVVRTVGNVLDRLATPEFLTGMQTVLDEISDEMPRLGDAVGDALLTIARNGDDIAEAFGNVVTVTGGLIRGGAQLLNTFTDVFNVMSGIASIDFGNILPGGQSGDREQAASDLEALQNLNDLILKAIPGVSDPFGNKLVESTREATGQTEKFAQEISGLNRIAEQAATEGLAEMAERQEQLSTAIDGTNERLAHEQDRLQQLKDSMFAAAEGVLGLRESTRTYEEALDSATETIKRNGETTDVNTQKGRENAEAIDEIAASALSHIEAMIEQGKSTKQVTAFTRQARKDFLRAADAAGIEEKQAKRLADQLGLVPSQVETKIKAIDQMSDTIDSLKRQLRELQRQAGVIPIGTSVGAFFGSSLIPPSEMHQGGKIGHGGIPRAHSGMRLAPDERVIIGQTGERILSREQNRAFEAGARMAGGGSGGVTVEHMTVQAWTDRFSLRQIEDELAFHGAA